MSAFSRANGRAHVCLLAAALWVGWAVIPGSAHASCTQNEFCADASAPTKPDAGPLIGGGGVDGCWSAELSKDVCNQPPAPCPPGSTGGVTFIDDLDGDNDGQLAVILGGDHTSCGTIKVTQTGYYKIFDVAPSESCKKQLDETAYVTITNSCNKDGWAAQANVGDRFLVPDVDNTPSCDNDSECAAGQRCRSGNMGGNCCVPDKPIFFGTFLLVSGEKNEICLHHFCPEYTEAKKKGKDLGFANAGCTGSSNSVHLRMDAEALACEDDQSLAPCIFGCQAGKCLPDPCDGVSCPGGFCKDGQCSNQNPCDALSCVHGCKNGRCLQAPSAPGVDADDDGFPASADCDDNNPSLSPAHRETCGNGLDDDCDGRIDEADDCSTGFGMMGDMFGGCACDLGGSPASWPALFVILCLLLQWRRRSNALARSGRTTVGEE